MKRCPMDFKDYYEILGVAPTADKKVIQQTFRQLARKHHPDVNPGNKDAEEKFKTINEAYQVLSDAKQRKKYDELRAQYQQWQKTGGRNSRISTGKTGQLNLIQGARTQYANAEDLEDFFGSDIAVFRLLLQYLWRSKASSGRSAPPSPRRGRDVEYEVDLTLEEAFRGTERALEIDGHRIQASIPLGVRTGTRVRLAGRGEPGRNGGAAGDLFLIIKVLPNDIFERDGDDLHMDAPVDIFTAIAGGEIRIPALEKPLTLTIPPRTNANRTFRLRGKGMPYLREPNKRGDMFARVKLVLPDALTDQEVEGITALASARQKHAEPSEVKL